MTAAIIPEQSKNGVFIQMSKDIGANERMEEYHRLVDALTAIRPLDFEVVELWTPDDKVSYKGCDRMKFSDEPVVCNK